MDLHLLPVNIEKTIGIFGGSFNPVHCGHIALANAVLQSRLVDEVWMMLSPLNPLKADSADMASDADRMNMLREACEGYAGLKPCDIELTMPRPNYTANTMRKLIELYPNYRFRLLIGADNLAIFHKWREHEWLMENFNPIVYPREGYDCAHCLDLPEIPVSSTEIRERIAEGLPVNKLVPPTVMQYIHTHNLYKY